MKVCLYVKIAPRIEVFFIRTWIEHYLKLGIDRIFIYNNGYDLSDIYYFLYEFVKDYEKYTFVVKLLCYYINQHCNGYYHKLYLVFLTNDIRNFYFSDKNKNKTR